ncbi:MAG: hypothetical protein KGM44_10890 [bacterium]|nr:hypothetical protein [bacterium]
MTHLLARLSETLEGDEEYRNVGRFFTADVLFQCGGARRLVRVRGGRIAELSREPGFDAPWDFALRAPEAIWEQFTRTPPPPFFTDIWAMRMRVPEFVWEGNTLLAAQNARALTRMTELLRVVRAQQEAAHGA